MNATSLIVLGSRLVVAVYVIWGIYDCCMLYCCICSFWIALFGI